MQPIAAMQAFVRVAELSSFTQAADQLGLPKAAVSAAVRSLEAELGTRLLHRTTRRVQLTQDGQQALQRCQDLLADYEELQQLFHGDGAPLGGRLRVDMPMGVARNVVLPALPAFLQAHPQLELDLSSTDRRVDPVREGFDCVLRVGPLGESSLVARPLGQYRMLNVASPAYLASHGRPESLQDLVQHRLVHYQATLGQRAAGFEYVDEAQQVRFQPMAGMLTVNNSESYLAACLAGLGIIQTPAPAMRSLIDTGQLVELLPLWQAAPMPVTLLYPHRRHQPKRVQVFMNWLAEVMRPYLAET
ncbi:LysR family transcriptional regulator [Pelomonas sp. SE-A7]|uniref:LysR family transcriptional regulator n=1 Tax=Pelomonas sp. SE-A7 TaxID=3054953 RepID=UPI00259CC3D9|nr:LysR family transcriptional regulator [Pelomonas sp. SE-A7]MDM4766775.1 LysR family transcriptional regulator [Pelomonas sp. SE-A7]